MVKTNKSKAKPVSSWRCQRQAGAMKALQWVVWSLIFLGFGAHLVIAEEQGSQVQQRMRSNSPCRLPTEEDASLGTCEGKRVEGAFCKDEKEMRNGQGKDPRTFKELVERW